MRWRRANKDKTGINRRQFFRLDSVFPVTFQFLGPGENEAAGPWQQGFTANLSYGGIGLNVPLLNAEELGLLKIKSGMRLNVKIHIPVFQCPIIALASVAWIRQEKNSSLGPYTIGLKYEKISTNDNRRVMRLVYFKARGHRFALLAIIIFFLGFAISTYYSLKLFSYNQNLIEGLVATTRHFSDARLELESVRKEKASLQLEFQEADSRISSTTKELNDKIESLERDLGSLQQLRDDELKERELQIQRLRTALTKLEQEKEALSVNIGLLGQKEETASMRLGEIEHRKTVLEKENFDMMYQWLKTHQNSRTGLLDSFEGDNQLEGQAFTYDQALAAIAFSYFGDYEQARKILDFYLTKAERAGGYYNAYYTSAGEPAEFIIHSGPNLWLGIAVLQYTQMSQDEKYLPIAKNIAGWIMQLQSLDPERGLQGGPDVSWFSTEHNLDGFAFFNMFYLLSKDTRCSRAAGELSGWLRKHAYDSLDVPVKRGRGDATIATDTYAWSIASLGPARLSELGMDPEEIMKFAQDNCSVAVEFERPGGETLSVKGFDFAKGRHVARGGVVSCEWTAQMVLSYKILSWFFASQSDSLKEKIYRDKANLYLEELTKMIISSPSRTGQGRGCLPYASCDFVDTGHGWMTPKGKSTGSVSATAYAIFAYYGFNPLELKPKQPNK